MADRLVPGKPIPARPIARLAELAEGVSGLAAPGLASGAYGHHLADGDRDPGFPARLVGSASPYGIVEVHGTPGGGHADLPGGRSCSACADEINGQAGLADAVVPRVRPGAPGAYAFRYNRAGHAACPHTIRVHVRHLEDASAYPGATVTVSHGVTTDATGTTDGAGFYSYTIGTPLALFYGVRVSASTPWGTCATAVGASVAAAACVTDLYFYVCGSHLCVSVTESGSGSALSGADVTLAASCVDPYNPSAPGAAYGTVTGPTDLGGGVYCFTFCSLVLGSASGAPGTRGTCYPRYAFISATAPDHADACGTFPLPCGESTAGLALLPIGPDYVAACPGAPCTPDLPGSGTPTSKGLVKKRLRLEFACTPGSGIGLPAVDLDYVGVVDGCETWASACVAESPTGVGYKCPGDPYEVTRPYLSVAATYKPCCHYSLAGPTLSYACYPADGCSDLTDCVPELHGQILGLNWPAGSGSPGLDPFGAGAACVPIITERA